VPRDPAQQSIAEQLAGRTLLLTGASGFLGKAVLAACLRSLPGVGSIRVVLRAANDDAARERLAREVLSASAFEAVSPADLGLAVETGRVTAVAGDLLRPRLGRDNLTALEGVDVAIHCAASVSFEEPLDQMLDLNVHGTMELINALREVGVPQSFVHVSTAYASGRRTGLVLERPSGLSPAEPQIDLEAELAAARSWRTELEADSRLPHHQKRFVSEASQEIGPAGAPAVGARAEELRRQWVVDELVARGRERSRALGWTDAYGLSKALAERHLLQQDLPGLTIVRPTIIESALHFPYPGWIEGLKVADPVILAYAMGMVPRFPGERSVRLDLVPVDLVANACIAAAAHPPADGPRTIAVASGSRNPVTIGEISEAITEYFRDHPLAGEDQLPVEVPEWRFTSSGRVLGALDRGQRAIKTARSLLDRVAVPRVDDAERRLHKEQRRLERLERLAQIYGPYTELDCMFDDRGARELLELLHPDDQDEFDFDTEAVHWPTYLKEVHLPALRELARPPRRGVPTVGRAKAEAGLPDGPPALALFDVEGVVLDATVVHFYAWLRGGTMPSLDRALWMATLGARVGGWMSLDRRSRASFNRAFYREYRGLPADELRERASAALSEFILPRVHHAAVRRIRAHRARGDRVILVTGALDFLVQPLEHLADELVAARLVERRGAFTGELAEPPLSADGRASLAARLAAEHGVDLSDCHAYGDSISDLPLLELVGHPVAVNPDFRLAREARRRGWSVVEWDTEPGARTRPPAPIEVAV
jgi:HAD superfamily hydrolase (TIGR01490 family)